MELKDRINAILEFSGLNMSEFSRFVGFKTPQVVRELIKGRTKTLSESAAVLFLRAFPNINERWLRAGEGEMLKDNSGSTPLVNINNNHTVGSRIVGNYINLAMPENGKKR